MSDGAAIIIAIVWALVPLSAIAAWWFREWRYFRERQDSLYKAWQEIHQLKEELARRPNVVAIKSEKSA